MNWKELEPNMAPLTGNESQYDEIYWSSEDEDEITEETASNKDEDMENEPTGEDSINGSYAYGGLEDKKVSTGATPKNKEREDTVDKFSEEEGTGTPDVYKEGKDKAYASSEDIPSNSEDETTQQSSQNGETDESGKSSGEENELRSRRDTSSKAQARTDTYKIDDEEHVSKSDLNSLNSVSNDKTSNRITDPI